MWQAWIWEWSQSSWQTGIVCFCSTLTLRWALAGGRLRFTSLEAQCSFQVGFILLDDIDKVSVTPKATLIDHFSYQLSNRELIKFRTSKKYLLKPFSHFNYLNKKFYATFDEQDQQLSTIQYPLLASDISVQVTVLSHFNIDEECSSTDF